LSKPNSMKTNSKVLITGAAGFIGFFLAKRMLKEGFEVVGLDNINANYDVNLKYARLAECGISAPGETIYSTGKNRNYHPIDCGQIIPSVTEDKYRFIRLNLTDKKELNELFEEEKFECVVHLAAHTGVRSSIENAETYIQSNLVGCLNILEASRRNRIKHLLYASSSSVYGAQANMPFSEDDKPGHPACLCASVKRNNETMAHVYSHLYNLPTTGLRFFTVYGPWGRPDMAPMMFARAIAQKEAIHVFNYGEMERDFIYIDDCIESICKIMVNAEHSENKAEVFNIGSGTPVNLLRFIQTIEMAFGKRAVKFLMPMQPDDVKQTCASIKKLDAAVGGYNPQYTTEKGVNEFMQWFKNYYQYCTDKKPEAVKKKRKSFFGVLKHRS